MRLHRPFVLPVVMAVTALLLGCEELSDGTVSGPDARGQSVSASGAPDGAGPPDGGGGGDDDGGSTSDVPLVVSVDDSRSGVQSDGGTASDSQCDGLDNCYVHALQDVEAVVLQSDDALLDGRAAFDTDAADSSTDRVVDLHVEDDGDGSVLFDGTADALINAKPDPQDGGGLLAMSVGDTLFGNLKVRWDDGSLAYTMRYGSDCGGDTSADADARKATVVMTDDNPRTWTVESNDADGDGIAGDAILCTSTLKGRPSSDRILVEAPAGLTLIEDV